MCLGQSKNYWIGKQNSYLKFKGKIPTQAAKYKSNRSQKSKTNLKFVR